MEHSNREWETDVIRGRKKPVAQRGSPLAEEGHSNPNSRPGRKSPHRAQGRESARRGGAMANGEVVVGVDVSTVRLDVALWPSGESLSVGNDAAGVAELLARIVQLHPQAVVVEASGGPED